MCALDLTQAGGQVDVDLAAAGLADGSSNGCRDEQLVGATYSRGMSRAGPTQ